MEANTLIRQGSDRLSEYVRLRLYQLEIRRNKESFDMYHGMNFFNGVESKKGENK